jgi:alpha-L-fucosidase 2
MNKYFIIDILFNSILQVRAFMRYHVNGFCLVLIFSFSAAYTQSVTSFAPASVWYQGYPVGNGRVGAMIAGGVIDESITLNEGTIWTGQPYSAINPQAKDAYNALQNKLLSQHVLSTNDPLLANIKGVPIQTMYYQYAGSLVLNFPHTSYTNYLRSLSLDSAVSTVTYLDQDGTRFHREMFSSYPDQVMVMRITSNKANAISFNATLGSPHNTKSFSIENANTLLLDGSPTPQSGEAEALIKYQVKVQIKAMGGTVTQNGNSLSVAGADNAILLFSIASNYVSWEDISGDDSKRCQSYLDGVANKTYDELLCEHMNDYQRLYNQTRIELSPLPLDPSQSTAEYVESYTGSNAALEELYFNFGKYMIIAASRPGGQAATLQGLWTASLNPPWRSNYTLNINTNMNYWISNVLDMPETQEPLFSMLKETEANGMQNSLEAFGIKDGWLLFHNLDLWRRVAIASPTVAGVWPVGGAWMLQHPWEHYLYTGDTLFLEGFFPLMDKATLFFEHFLIRNHPKYPRWLLTGPSTSPEQGLVTVGTTMDNQLIRDLLENTIKASEILGKDISRRTRLRELLDSIPPGQVGTEGQLKEFLHEEEVKSTWNEHRHVAHLYGLFPGHQISPKKDSVIFNAAVTSLLKKRVAHSGGNPWAQTYNIPLWARAGDPDYSYENLKKQIIDYSQINLIQKVNNFNNNYHFQFDRSIGITAGITEMLFQSHDSTLHLLPALPEAWPSGSITGLRGRGGYRVDISWDNGNLVKAVVDDNFGSRYQFKIAGEIVTLPDSRIDIKATSITTK